jgi:tRNA threonylcarbamoyladenosine biosynthesis protein TsaE
MIFESFSQIDTENFATELAKKAIPGDFYALIGDLGAGKTAFAKGFARGLGITAHISSPTFSLINEYNTQGQKMPLYHFDVYRIQDPQEMEETGYEEYFYGGVGVTLVEWADLIKDIFPPNATTITFEHDPSKGENYRRISVAGTTPCKFCGTNVSKP